MSKHQKRHKNYRKFLDWKAQRDKDNNYTRHYTKELELVMEERTIRTLDSKYNDYNGHYQGRVLNVEQWGKYGVVSNPDGFGRIMEYPNKRFILMTDEKYYKEFCQLDHMINDRAFMRYLREFVSTSQTSDKGITEHKSIIELLWEHDVDVMYACEDGWCGNCKVGLISGKVEHRDRLSVLRKTRNPS